MFKKKCMRLKRKKENEIGTLNNIFHRFVVIIHERW